MSESKSIAESIAGISFEEIKSLANNEAKSKFLGDQLRLTYVDGYQSGFDKGAEEMAKIKDAQIEKLVTTLQGAKWELELAGKYEAGQSIKKVLENFRRAAEGSASFRKGARG